MKCQHTFTNIFAFFALLILVSGGVHLHAQNYNAVADPKWLSYATSIECASGARCAEHWAFQEKTSGIGTEDGEYSPPAPLLARALSLEIPAGPQGFDAQGRLQLDTKLAHPAGIAIDSVGNFLIADDAAGNLVNIPGVHRLLRVAPGTGKCTVIIKGGDKQPDPVTDAFADAGPSGLVVDRGGNLFTLSPSLVRNIVYRISPKTAAVTWYAGVTLAEGTFTQLHEKLKGRIGEVYFFLPRGLAVDGAGNVYVAGDGVRKIDAQTGAVTTIVGGWINAHSQKDPQANSGKTLTDLTKTPISAVQFDLQFSQEPYGFIADATGNLYFTGPENSYGNSEGIGKYSAATGMLSYLPIPHYKLDKLDVDSQGKPLTRDPQDERVANHHGLAVDSQGSLYFYERRSLWRWNVSDGQISRVAIMPSAYHGGPLVLDGSDNLYALGTDFIQRIPIGK